MKKLLLLVVAISCFAFNSSATHLMGGEITAKEIAPGTYIVHLEIFRDSLGINVSGYQTYDLSDALGTFIATYNLTMDSTTSGTAIPGYPYGVEPYNFYDTLYLTAPSQYSLTWNQCCRNGAIQNLSAPLTESMTLSTTLTYFAAANNSTPVFLAPPVIYLPAMTAWQYNPTPFDIDGDSLHWSIDLPLGDNGFPCAGYVDPFSDPSGPFSIDPVTGIISWTASTQGNFVASILVEEYRGGVKIGEIRRDMQYIVIAPQSSMPTFNNIGGVPLNPAGYPQLDIYYNQPFTYTFQAVDADQNDVLRLSAYGGMFDLPTNPATFNFSFPGAAYNVADGVFSWTPDNSSGIASPYLLTLRANDGLFAFDETVLVAVSADPLSIEEREQFAVTELFPNPAKDLVTINMNLPQAELVHVSLIDIQGRIIQDFDKNLPMGQNLLQMEVNAPAGHYFIKINTSTGAAVTLPLVLIP